MIRTSVSPVDTGFGRILEMGRNLTRSALDMGLDSTKPVRLPILGMNLPQGWDILATRRAIVSFSQPIPSKYEVELWVNPINKRIFKSIPSEQQWNLVLTYQDLFSEANETVASASALADTPGQPLNTLADLQGINTTSAANRTVVYVEESQMVYSFDVNGSGPSNPPDTIAPNVGPGVWVRVDVSADILGLTRITDPWIQDSCF